MERAGHGRRAHRTREDERRHQEALVRLRVGAGCAEHDRVPDERRVRGDLLGGLERDGADLSCEVPITFTTAALGGEVEVPTLEGTAKIKVPAETVLTFRLDRALNVVAAG